MTPEDWAEMECGLEARLLESVWHDEMRSACNLAITLRDKLDAAIMEMVRAQHRAEELLADTNLACELAERFAEMGP